MRRLKVTYERGKFLIGAGRMAVDLDGGKGCILKDKESRTFDLEDGKHTLVFSNSYCTKRVDVNLSGDDSFIVTWDRILGGIRIVDEDDSNRFYRRSSILFLVLDLVVLFLILLMNVLNREGVVSTTAFHFCVVFAIILMVISMVIIFGLRSRTVVRDGKV